MDPTKVSDVLQLLNPSTLASISKLFPDGKYDVALLQDSFARFDETADYCQESTNWLHQIRGKPDLCYLSHPEDGRSLPTNVNHLLKTQRTLDSKRLHFYIKQLKDLMASGNARPTALVLDFFNEGQIHDVRPDEDAPLGFGGRRQQKRRAEGAEAEYVKRNSELNGGQQSGCFLCFCSFKKINLFDGFLKWLLMGFLLVDECLLFKGKQESTFSSPFKGLS